MGKIQGLVYKFAQVEGEDNIIIQKVDPCADPMIIDVGYYDGEECIFTEEYQEIHDMNMTAEEQDEVEWK